MRSMHGDQTVDVPVASAGSISTFVDIAGATRIAIDLPAFGTLFATSTANVFVQVAATSDATFRELRDMGVYSANSGLQRWETPSTTGDETYLCRPVVGFNFMKIAFTTAATDGYTPVIHRLY